MESQIPSEPISATYRPILDSVNRSRKILIALPVSVAIDHVSAGYALQTVLQKMGKDVVVGSSSSLIPPLNFLEKPPVIQSNVAGSSVAVIDVATTHAQLEELSYQSDESGVRIFLKPKQGQFLPEDVVLTQNSQPFDLVIVIGAHTLEDLGALYTDNATLFFEKPKIAIDNDPSNEYFGTINLIDVAASALSEVVYEMVQSMESATIDEPVATALLAGIISTTHSFQNPSTTPKTFTIASSLIAKGARQQDVIKYLYKTKDFSLLKLWGRALARIKTLNDNTVLYSLLTRGDFEKTGETEQKLPVVMRELLENVTGFQTVILIAETTAGALLMIAGLPHARIEKLAAAFAESFGPMIPIHGLYQAITITLADMSLEEAEAKLLKVVNPPVV